VKAHAKVNLSLEVHPADGSGYHPLDSVVQTVSLADRLTVEVADADAVVVDGRHEVPSEGNLVLVALDALRRRVPDLPGFSVGLHKDIPPEAGLGGGSADAAAVLQAVARWAPGVDLLEVASDVGSDVPALVLGGTVHMTGRGDRVARLAPVVGTRWLVVVPPFGVPTPAAYRAWDGLGGPTGSAKDWPATAAAIGRPVRNDLEPAAVMVRPEIVDWLEALSVVAGRPSMVSGSGSACFVEVDEPSADAAADHPVLARARLIADVVPVGPSAAPE
jgi:4-diphosphocytidyl-2-C-methyl-D-erythritol kinase